MSIIKKAAAYLGQLPDSEYGVTKQLSAATNYLLDSYFAKLDDRARRNARPPRWYPAEPFNHIRELWLGCQLHVAVTLNQRYPAFAKAHNAYAFTRLFEGETAQYKVVPFLDTYEFKEALTGSYAMRIQSERMAVGPADIRTLPVFGNFFVEQTGTGAHLFISVDFCFESIGCNISAMAAPEHSGAVEQFFADMQQSLIANDIYYKKCLAFDKGALDFMDVAPTEWSSVILKTDVRDQIRANTVAVLEGSETLAKLGMCPNQNMILISPPGMAKTTIFRAISHEIEGRITRIWCTGKSIDRSEHVTNLFEAARTLAPCIIFIEDMDLFGRDRSSGLYGSDNHVLNEFLACLDGAQLNSGVVVMASTNDIASMDEALVDRPGRFDIKIEMPPPDAEDRSLMMASFMKQFHAAPDQSVNTDCWKNIVESTKGLTGAYIRSLVKAAVIRAVAEGRTRPDGSAVVITADDLGFAVNQIMANHAIGKKAKKHHQIEGGITVT